MKWLPQGVAMQVQTFSQANLEICLSSSVAPLNLEVLTNHLEEQGQSALMDPLVTLGTLIIHKISILYRFLNKSMMLWCEKCLNYAWLFYCRPKKGPNFDFLALKYGLKTRLWVELIWKKCPALDLSGTCWFLTTWPCSPYPHHACLGGH